MEEISFSTIIRNNREAGERLRQSGAKPFAVNLLSNITVNQLVPVLEYRLRQENIYATCRTGDYDNIVQDSSEFPRDEYYILFWELANFVPGAHYRTATGDDAYYKPVLDKIKSDVQMVFRNLKDAPLVLFNLFSTLPFNAYEIGRNRFDDLCREANDYIRENLPSNFFAVETEKLISIPGVKLSVNHDAYLASKALYTVAFFREYAEYVFHIFAAVAGKAKKAVIMDCDNTLWHGIIGEDGAAGIEMSARTKKGEPYEEVQYYLLDLKRRGVILGICSKNNDEDVIRVLEDHPDCRLREKDVAIRSVNWLPKDSNLREIASGLNIGTDSLVFVDDSEFEINLVRASIPEILVMPVPVTRNLYPDHFRRMKRRFFSMSFTSEDLKRSEIYREQAVRSEAQKQFASIDEYLESLEMEVDISRDDAGALARIAQMTQKTNQFNLTTKRYTEAEVEKFIRDDNHQVYSLSVRDKFGDSGITGLCIVKTDNGAATIDTLLLSCRVIGRNVEKVFFDHVVNQLNRAGVKKLTSQFIRTAKNAQVEELYERLGMTETERTETHRKYEMQIDTYKSTTINYIKINSNEGQAQKNNG